MNRPLTDAEASAVERNLFPGIAATAVTTPGFPWHRNRGGRITADRPHSSQALAISVFGTIAALGSRVAVLNAWADAFGIAHGSGWKIDIESLAPQELLCEPRPTQIDVAASSENALVLFECKFTETDGGGCSQVKSLRSGRHDGIRQCDGTYRPQTNPVNGVRSRCALSGKGIRYWEWIPVISSLSPDVDHDPCPFKGGSFQWMRNLVACAALASSRSTATVIVYPEGPFPMAAVVASDEWKAFTALVAVGRVQLRTISYQQLLQVAAAAADASDRPLVTDLQRWATSRIETVAAGLIDRRR